MSSWYEERKSDWEEKERQRVEREAAWRLSFSKAALKAQEARGRKEEGRELAEALFRATQALMRRENPAEAEHIGLFARSVGWNPDLGGESSRSKVELFARRPNGNEWQGSRVCEEGAEFEAVEELAARAVAETFWLGEYEPVSREEAEKSGFEGNGCQSFVESLGELGSFGERLRSAFETTRARRDRERSLESMLGKALAAQADTGGILEARGLGRIRAIAGDDGQVWLGTIERSDLFGGRSNLFGGSYSGEGAFRLGRVEESDEKLVDAALRGIARVWIEGEWEKDLGVFSDRVRAKAEKIAFGEAGMGAPKAKAPRGI